MRQRGFTLLEVVIVVAIVITVATLVFAASVGTNPITTRSAVTQLDAALAYGRGLAETSGNGATLLFLPRHPGVTIDVYSGRPTASGALQSAGIAPFVLNADIVESSVGNPPFAVFLNSAGGAAVAGFSGATPPPTASEPACPPSGRWVLMLSGGGSAMSMAQRSLILPCPTRP